MWEYDRERIKKLRLPAIDSYISYEDIYINFYRRFAENNALMHLEKRWVLTRTEGCHGTILKECDINPALCG